MKPGYRIAVENGCQNVPEIWPLYQQHYAEMKARLAADGVRIGEFNPNVSEYLDRLNGGSLINYVARFNGKAVGYSNVYITNDMHNQELIAVEDTIFVVPEHRNGLGREMVKFILADLKRRGVVRVRISPVTDLRVGKIWERMGFKPVASIMQYTF